MQSVCLWLSSSPRHAPSAEFTHGVCCLLWGAMAACRCRVCSGRRSFRSSDVDRIVNVRGAVDEPWAQFRATILVTVIDATQTPVTLLGVLVWGVGQRHGCGALRFAGNGRVVRWQRKGAAGDSRCDGAKRRRCGLGALQTGGGLQLVFRRQERHCSLRMARLASSGRSGR